MNKDELKVIVTDGLGNVLTDKQVQEYQLYFKKKNEINANPKLKAQELIDDANQILTSYDDIRLKGKHFEISKRFALMTLKEIRGCINWNHYPLDKQWIFWDEVKQEIDKMSESYPYQDKANEFKDNDRIEINPITGNVKIKNK